MYALGSLTDLSMSGLDLGSNVFLMKFGLAPANHNDSTNAVSYTHLTLPTNREV
mgnify:CR=1 FL=1